MVSQAHKHKIKKEGVGYPALSFNVLYMASLLLMA